MEDALISPESFAILSGAGLLSASKDEPVYVHSTYQTIIEKDNTIKLPEAPCWNHQFDNEHPQYQKNADIFVMTMTNGQIDSEPCIPANIAEDGVTLTCYGHNGRIERGTLVFVDFYVKRTGGVQTIEITPDKFGGYYYVEASTLFRDEQSGVDMPAEFVIPKAKVQSNFTFSMTSSGDPSTFTFTMDAFPDYTKFKEDKKVLAIINVITEAVDDQDDKRTVCWPAVKTPAKNVTITTENRNDGQDMVATGEVTGTEIENKELFGSQVEGKNVTEVLIDVPVPAGVKYSMKQVNPALKYYEGDSNITKDAATGDYIKNGAVIGEINGTTLSVLLSDVVINEADEKKQRDVTVELYAPKSDGSYDKEPTVKYVIENDITFKTPASTVSKTSARKPQAQTED